MTFLLPDEVKKIIEMLEANGHEAYIVGGCVRDCFLDRVPSDWDITTSAKPEEVKQIFPFTIDTGLKHGTVTVRMNHRSFEVTTYRIDGEYTDGRHPDDVTFTDNLYEDLKRRDFTINAMAYNEREGLVDRFNGQEDLNDKIIRAVGEPRERFTEDALRMMRAVRFAAQLDFTIDKDTFDAITELSYTLRKVSAERIRTEFEKTLVSSHPEFIRQVYETHLTTAFIPEFDIMMKTEQHSPHHDYTVGEHTIRVVKEVPEEKVIRLAALLHDVAKPMCKTTDSDGRDHFYGHPEMGEELSADILRRLKYDNDTIYLVKKLVRYHDERPENSLKSVRHALSKIGTDIFPALFDLKRADTLAQSDYQREEKLQAIDDFERNYNDIKDAEEAVSVKDLMINGTDLISMGYTRGPEIGSILAKLLDHVLDHPEDNNKRRLKELVSTVVRQ
ncbi:MAG: CCA tRNA nucleotidyltransferase [Lachnospiraceae bacterium]|nr:CCA tRNA nucleotidyltransferase [Lachnospiraceae bacterium]